jgi:hypothetical protein
MSDRPDIAVRLEQFKNLTADRKLIDQQMWQVPVACFAVVGLVLNALRPASSPLRYDVLALLSLIGGGVAAYGILLVARLHLRREVRERRLLELENDLQTRSECKSRISTTFQPIDLARERAASSSPVNRYFARVASTPLAIGVLGLTGSAFICVFAVSAIESLRVFDHASQFVSLVVAFALGIGVGLGLNAYRRITDAALSRSATSSEAAESLHQPEHGSAV